MTQNLLLGLGLLIRPRIVHDSSSIWTHPDGSKAQTPHGAVGHLADPGDFGIGCIRQARRTWLGGVVPEEEDGQSSIMFTQPLRVLDGGVILLVGVLLHRQS